jgi:hypothetical protein
VGGLLHFSEFYLQELDLVLTVNILENVPVFPAGRREKALF